MKIARVIPIFKSGDSSLLTIYRAVSVLPVFSKLLGKVVYNRILKYLDKHCHHLNHLKISMVFEKATLPLLLCYIFFEKISMICNR